MTFPQEKGPEVQLAVFGDEFYARYQDQRGYSGVYDSHLGLYCYARLEDGEFVSSGVPISTSPPPDLVPGLRESEEVRRKKVHESMGRKGFRHL